MLVDMLEGFQDEEPTKSSEAASLAALLELGKRALKERVLETEYQAMAAEQDEEDRAVRAAMRRRRRLSPVPPNECVDSSAGPSLSGLFGHR